MYTPQLPPAASCCEVCVKQFPTLSSRAAASQSQTCEQLLHVCLTCRLNATRLAMLVTQPVVSHLTDTINCLCIVFVILHVG
jgi:hypothetical protein